MKAVWYKRKDGTHVLKYGKWKLLEITKKSNGEYRFYKCLVFNKGNVVAAEGLHGSSLREKYHAVRWGCKKAKELKLW